MNGNDTFLDINNAHLRVNNGNVQASTFVLDQIDFIASSNASTTVGFNNPTTAFLAASNIEVGTANLFVDTSTSNVGIGTNAPQDTLHINGGTRISGHILPTVNDTYDLGSAEYKIRHLFLGNSSLWLGDETRITFTGGKMKFRRRRKNALPRGLATIAAARGHTSEQQTTTAALTHAGVSTVEEMKLEHWIDYTKTLDETKEINDIFTEDAADYEATTASEAFKEIGDDIFSAHNVAIGKTTAPTTALDVVGTVKATAFEGDGSALTGIVAGQWTESDGNISRSTGNVSVGEQSSEQTVTQNYNNLTNIPTSSRSQGNWRSHTFGNITLPANWSNDNFQFKVTVNGNLNGVATAEYITITMKKQGSGTQPSVGLNFNPQNQSSGISSSGGRVYYTNVVVTNSTVSNGSFSAGDVVDIYMSIYSTYWYQLSLAVEIRGGGTTSILFVDGTNDRVGIGLTQPTTALDVSGTVKATAFEGDGSALTGIVAGQWTESSGDIYRSSGNVGIGVTNPESVLEVSDTLTNYKIKAVTLNGVPEGGAYYGYILLAKAATGGIDSESYAMGRILARRGSSTSGHKINYYDVVSSRGYNHYETFSVNHVGNRTGNDGFTSTVKVTYNGVVYHALRTGSTGGQPTTDLAFWGASKDAALIMVDSSMISNETSYGHIAFSAVNGNVGIGKIPDAGKKLDVNGTVKATAFEGDGSALTGISGGGQWTYTAGASVGTQQLVFDDQAPGTTFTGTLSGNANNTAIRDTSNRYIRVTQGGTSRIGSVYWQTTLTNNWEATFEIYILPINYGGADDMRFIFYATNPITSNDGATGTNGHGGAYMRWEYYNSDYVELYDHTATAVVSSSASLQMNGWMPVTVTFNNGQLTSTIKNSSGTTLKTTTYDFGTTYSARYNTPTYVAVTGRSGGVQAEDRVRNITINALNVQTADKLTRMNTNIGIDVASPTQKLDVAGTVKATAFEGDGSALTGVTSGQWTDSGGNIYRSSGNVGIGIDPSSSAKFQVSGGKVIFGDVGAYGAAVQDAQVTIGGTHNSSTYYNTNSQVKLLITGGDNDSYSPYYIKCEDENGKDQFYLKGATSDGGSNGILYSRNNVGIGTTTARAGLHAYVQYPIFGKTSSGSGLICDDIGYAKWRQTCGSYHLTFQRHNSSSSTNYTSWTSRGYLHKDYGNTRLNFTGQHRTFIGDVPFTQAESKEGLIVSANSDTYIKMSDGIAYGANAITINECLPVVTLSQTANDKACFGVISLSEDPETREDAFGTFVSVAEKEKGDTRVFINSVGEGGIWITDKNGTLESGDYVTTSTIPGYGVKQEDDILHNYTVAKMTMNCDFNPTLQKVKRIKKKLVDVQYWVHVSNVTVTKEQYDELQPEFRRIIQDEDGNDIYQTNDRTEWTHDPVEEDGIETYTEIRNELQNELDEHGQIQWEDTDDFEKAYKMRYILPDATQISESEYDAKIAAGEEAYKAAFVGCTYHCG